MQSYLVLKNPYPKLAFFVLNIQNNEIKLNKSITTRLDNCPPSGTKSQSEKVSESDLNL